MGIDASNFWTLLVPAMCLAGLGFAVPRVLALFWPEGVKWLLLLALVATVIMGLLGAGFFALLYMLQGDSFADLYRTNGIGTIVHFGRLSVVSSLMWAPLMVLSIIYIPRNWVKEVW
ncbi:hypothetical protein [Pseudooctadecabacter jejudonensis]|uniref:Uncharacterized protein n=1 Tax=Pseudooctadecabacter jejudonensis TaxID=1391910 RepID=A0A1Y5TB01_9RHOB|nr:hypothetical protein [Pseudooctadecabacter jejudonensis]SLN56316.1 hypothetical protein PSJ8397_02985 [Pseudooctadecabacter jejudonensis]